MTLPNTQPFENTIKGLSRRALLSRSLATGALFVVGGGFVAARDAAWALETTTLKPETLATLIQMARDIYPHDKIADRFYAIAVKGYDTAERAEFIENGVIALNTIAQSQGHSSYLGAAWEDERVSVLKTIEHSDFFQTIRSGLVTGLYNQKEVWPIFGYEGESFSHGGYIDRGFNDIDWL